MLSDEEAESIREQLLEQIGGLSIEEEQKEKIKEQIENASAKELEAFLKQQEEGSQGGSGAGGGCLFCEIAKGKVETVKVYEDRDIMAVMDIMPASKGHLIVFPKEHYHFIQEIPDALLNKIFYFIKKIVPIIVETLKAEAVSIYLPQGTLAGQRIAHFVVNVIPRYKDDKLVFDWQRKKHETKELEQVAEKIRKKAEHDIKAHISEEKEKHEKAKKQEQDTEAEKIYKHVRKRMP